MPQRNHTGRYRKQSQHKPKSHRVSSQLILLFSTTVYNIQCCCICCFSMGPVSLSLVEQNAKYFNCGFIYFHGYRKI